MFKETQNIRHVLIILIIIIIIIILRIAQNTKYSILFY
jgi:hypothetical protein